MVRCLVGKHAGCMMDSWKHLLAIAIDLIEQANRPFPVIDVWTLGGGTAMMIQIDHRESRDIDIFFDDPQILAYLDPGKRNFELHVPPSGYHGDGARFLRLAFESLGEIDFIACPALTAHPSISSVIDGRRVEVETLEEIIAKKVFFRGAQIKPRDISISRRHLSRTAPRSWTHYPGIAPRPHAPLLRSSATVENI